MRHPVLHAKIMATIDHVSGGRFVLGAGVGWWKEEFEVLGVPFERRGKRMDECLQLIRALWTEEYVDFRGEFRVGLYEAVGTRRHHGHCHRRRRRNKQRNSS